MSVLLSTILLLNQGPITLQFRPRVGSNLTFSVKEFDAFNVPFWTHYGLEIVALKNGFYEVKSNSYEGPSSKPGRKNATDLVTLNSAGNAIENPKVSGKPVRQLTQYTIRGGIRSNWRSSFVFPSKPIKLGETWEYKEELGATLNRLRQLTNPRGKNDLHYNEYIYKGTLTEKFKLEKIDSQSVTVGCQVLEKLGTDFVEHSGKNKSPVKVGQVSSVSTTAMFTLDRQTGVLISCVSTTSFKRLDPKTKKYKTFNQVVTTVRS